MSCWTRLRRPADLDNTIVICTSDHGDYCGAHGLYCKGVPAFREGYNIPLRRPLAGGIERPGREVTPYARTRTWPPRSWSWRAARTGWACRAGASCRFLEGQPAGDWRDEMHLQFNGVEVYYTQRSLTTKEFKYVYNAFDFDELYDLRNDPHEMVNLAEEQAYQIVKQELVRRMWRFAAAEGDDIIFNPYATVALAPWGPAEGLRER